MVRHDAVRIHRHVVRRGRELKLPTQQLKYIVLVEDPGAVLRAKREEISIQADVRESLEARRTSHGMVPNAAKRMPGQPEGWPHVATRMPGQPEGWPHTF